MKLIRTKFESGERYSLLVNEFGMPLWYPTLFATSQLRNATKAPNTIEAYLNAIKLLLGWCNAEDLILENLFLSKLFLTPGQIELLCNRAKEKINTSKPKVVRKTINLSKERARAKFSIGSIVSNQTLYIRLSYIADYIDWLANQVISERMGIIDINTSYQIKRMVKAIKARRPIKSVSSRNFRKGLTLMQREVLITIITPEHQNNPFSNLTKERDALIIDLFYITGMRQGELLSIRISDLDFHDNTLLIPRRHDDISDPRVKQPVVKTLDRRVPLTRNFSARIHNYILKERIKIKPARKNEFLFVTYKEGPYYGAPLSQSGLTNIFKRIQMNSKELQDLTPHILRHNWNDMFSEKSDEIGRKEEEKLRSFLMGWKEGSGTSAIYTRRHIEKKAHEASLQLQGAGNNEDS